MEQTWYLFPGQTLENTKPEQRGKALIASPEGWKKITGYLTKKAELQAIADEEKAHRQYLKDGSKSMTANWENSIEKMRQRRFEEHDLKAKAREEELYRRFHELRAEQAEERKVIVAEARKRIHVMKQDSRTLNSALLLTEVLTERGLQQQFDAKLQADEDEEEDKYAQLVTYNANKEKEENAEKKRRWKEKELKYSQELKKQIEEIEENNKKEFEERRAKEIEDQKRAKEEHLAIIEYEHLLDKQKKNNVKQQLINFRAEQTMMREQARKQDEAEDKIVKLYAKAKCVIDEKKKRREKEFHEEQVKVRAKMAAKLGKEAADKSAEEERIRLQQQKELEESLIAREKRDAEFKEKQRQDRLEDRRRVIERKAQLDKVKKELQEWEMVNRLKTDEVLKDYEQNKAQRLFDEKIEYRRILDKQVKEDDTSKYDKYCSEQELLFYKKQLEEEDKAFFSYAEEVLDLAKSRGRSTIPIERVIQKYKVVNNLEPKGKNISHLKSKVPINNKEK